MHDLAGELVELGVGLGQQDCGDEGGEHDDIVARGEVGVNGVANIRPTMTSDIRRQRRHLKSR
jgi:hypothetical protein